MRILMTSRGRGKTYECVQMLKANANAILIVPLERQKDLILQQYKYKSIKNRVFSCVDLLNNKLVGFVKTDTVLILDNLEAILQCAFKRSVVFATITIEDRFPDSVYCSIEG
jgi:hypothetical protein